MSCCGGNRSRVASTQSPSPAPRTDHAHTGASVAIFRYEGRTALTVWGRETGRKYWFSSPGAEIAVDLRDRASMRQVPNVKEVRLA